jgi:glycosyltransferase involved in cell wall biosynthesis
MIGASPPPYHGSIMMFWSLMNSPLRERFRLIHQDISDHRDMENLGRLDLENVRLGICHALAYYRALRRERPDLVYAPVAITRLGFLRDSLFLLLARAVRPRPRCVVHAHTGHFHDFYREAPAPLRAYIRGALKGVDAAVVHSERLIPMFEGLVPAERTWPVPNGIEGVPDALRAAYLARGHTDRPPTVLYLGYLAEAKGVLDILAAAPLVARAVPGVRFVLVGPYFQPGDREQVERRLRDPEIRAVVELPGLVKGDARFERMLEADLFLFPSHFEGQPTVLLEAMSAGLPVVTTDEGAIRDTIVEGETGYLVPKRDPVAIARRVVELLRDEPLRLRMGAAGRRRFEEQYRVEHYGLGMARVFETVLSGSVVL